jgi:predicted membrane protein
MESYMKLYDLIKDILGRPSSIEFWIKVLMLIALLTGIFAVVFQKYGLYQLGNLLIYFSVALGSLICTVFIIATMIIIIIKGISNKDSSQEVTSSQEKDDDEIDRL